MRCWCYVTPGRNELELTAALTLYKMCDCTVLAQVAINAALVGVNSEIWFSMEPFHTKRNKSFNRFWCHQQLQWWNWYQMRKRKKEKKTVLYKYWKTLWFKYTGICFYLPVLITKPCGLCFLELSFWLIYVFIKSHSMVIL